MTRILLADSSAIVQVATIFPEMQKVRDSGIDFFTISEVIQEICTHENSEKLALNSIKPIFGGEGIRILSPNEQQLKTILKTSRLILSIESGSDNATSLPCSSQLDRKCMAVAKMEGAIILTAMPTLYSLSSAFLGAKKTIKMSETVIQAINRSYVSKNSVLNAIETLDGSLHPIVPSCREAIMATYI